MPGVQNAKAAGAITVTQAAINDMVQKVYDQCTAAQKPLASQLVSIPPKHYDSTCGYFSYGYGVNQSAVGQYVRVASPSICDVGVRELLAANAGVLHIKCGSINYSASVDNRQYYRDLYKENVDPANVIIDNNYTPKAGDIALFAWTPKAASHVGIMTSETTVGHSSNNILYHSKMEWNADKTGKPMWESVYGYFEFNTCPHTEYTELGFCKNCGMEFNWRAQISKSGAGVYVATGTTEVHVAPYGAAQSAGTLFKGKEYNVVEVTYNAFGNKWYHVQGNGVDAWEYEPYLEWVRNFPCDIKINIEKPANITVGKGFTVKGTITSSVPVVEVRTAFVNIKNQAIAPTPAIAISSVYGTTIDIESQVDKDIYCNQVPVGVWRIAMIAYDENGGYAYGLSEPYYVLEKAATVPLSVWSQVDKTDILEGEAITATYGANKSSAYYLHVVKDGVDTVVRAADSGAYSYTLQTPGTYSVYVGATTGSESAYSEPTTVAVRSRDSQPPVVTSTSIFELNGDSYTLSFSATDDVGLDHFAVGTWNDAIGINQAKWQYIPVSGTSANGRATISAADFGGLLNTTYHTNVYAYDTSGKQSAAVRAFDRFLESEKPVILDAHITQITDSGFDFEITAADNNELNTIAVLPFVNNSFGFSIRQSVSGTQATVTIHYDALYKNCFYHFAVYANDKSGNQSGYTLIPRDQKRDGLCIPKAGSTGTLVVKGYVEDEETDSLFGTVNVFVNDQLVAEGVRSYTGVHPAGSTYRVEPMSTDSRYRFAGIVKGQLQDYGYERGIIPAETVTVLLSYSNEQVWTELAYYLPSEVTPELYDIQYKYLLGSQSSAESPGDGWTTDGVLISGEYFWSLYSDWLDEQQDTGELRKVRYKAKSTPLTDLSLSTRLVERSITTGLLQITPTLTPANAFPVTLQWSSSREDVAQVADGLVYLIQPGAAVITCAPEEAPALRQSALVVVRAENSLRIPEGTQTIEADAFAGNTAMEELVLPSGIRSIESGAFSGCTGLRLVIAPDSLTDIADDAFTGCEDVTVICHAGSAMARFCSNAPDSFEWYDLRDYGADN